MQAMYLGTCGADGKWHGEITEYGPLSLDPAAQVLLSREPLNQLKVRMHMCDVGGVRFGRLTSDALPC